MIIIFPEDTVNLRKPDESFIDQAKSFKNNNHTILSINDRHKIVSGINFEAPVPAIYRGWMMTIDEYSNLYSALINQNVVLITNPEQYKRCHYISGWYDSIKQMTANTVLFDNRSALNPNSIPKWGRYFVKDYVKSLTTKRGSIANSYEEILEILALIEKYRGFIEGGICIREYENYLPESEERYFYYNGKYHSRDNRLPSIIESIESSIDCPFYSIDVIRDDQGNDRIVEIGDGQVSDFKNWTVNTFTAIFN